MTSELQLSRAEDWVRTKLDERVSIGQQLLSDTSNASNMESLGKLRDRYTSWSEFNWTLLQGSFEGPIDGEYFAVISSIRSPWAPAPSLSEVRDELCDDIKDKIRRLESIRDRLVLFEDPTAEPEASHSLPDPTRAGSPISPSQRNDAVFLVHGHAKGPKQQIARWLERVGLDPVILHEQANGGRTIIEKFAEEAGGVAFAIVLATGDDEGGLRGQGKLEPRPRQNVVLELGFFLGKLGRGRVVVLLEPDVALPSDYDGVVYIDLDANEGWKLKLAQELVAAGIAIDKTKLVGA